MPARAEDRGLSSCGLESGNRDPKISQPSPGTAAGGHVVQAGQVAVGEPRPDTWWEMRKHAHLAKGKKRKYEEKKKKKQKETQK